MAPMVLAAAAQAGRGCACGRAAFGNVTGWPTRCPPRPSRVRSTCCCTSCPRTRWTSSTCRSCPWSTGSSASSPSERELIDVNQLSEFLLVAAILVELKSQRLLPGPEDVDDDEELVGWEERDLLLARLLECRAYAAAADVFVALAEQAARSRAPRGGARRRLRGPRPRPAGRGHRGGPGPGLPAGLGRAARAPRWTSPTSRWTRSRSPRRWPTLIARARDRRAPARSASWCPSARPAWT